MKIVLRNLYDSGIRLNKEKSALGKEKVVFLGHEISSEGIRPHSQKQSAIDKFPKPKTSEQLRSFLGMASYIGQRFVESYATLAAPLWDMLKEKSTLVWTQDTERAFFDLRKSITEAQCLTFFDPTAPIVVQTDASPVGLSGVMLQNNKIVCLASRKLSPVEKRYSQLEKEFLAIVFALHRFRHLLFGSNFHVQTDNRALIFFFKRNIDSLPMRIQRWMLTLQPFNFSIEHIPGKKNFIADTLSRSPVDEESKALNEEKCEYTAFFVNQAVTPVTVDEIARFTAEDDLLCEVKRSIDEGWPASSRRSCPQFFNIRQELTCVPVGDFFVICRFDRSVIPISLRQRILEIAHEGHIGVSKMKETLRTHAYWPGLSTDVEDFSKRCSICLKFSSINTKAPLQQVANEVESPWEKIALDLTGPSEKTNNKILLTIIDYYSRYPFACVVSSGSSEQIIGKLIEVFSKFGFPSELVTDNGTCFTSQTFADFLASLGIKHLRSSIYFPSSNGVVERFHATLKSRSEKLVASGLSFTLALEQALFDIRSTPHEGTGQTPFFFCSTDQ